MLVPVWLSGLGSGVWNWNLCLWKLERGCVVGCGCGLLIVVVAEAEGAE